jgi:effector-binding domain-containing protein
MKYLIFSLLAIIGLGLFTNPTTPNGPSLRKANTYGFPDSVKIQLERTSFKDMPVLYLADTAASTEAIKDKLGRDYKELMQFLNKNKLQPLKFIAWYYTTQAPWHMDVAIQTLNIPGELGGRIQSRIQKGGEVIIAHMWGPYDQVGQAYAKIEMWLQENKRKAGSPPFEVYLNDPATVKSPSEIRTDVYQPLE